ncbi:unnamed protein product [Peronospora belbahrii]|uniref:non-specific serine/threonine protein kinase n=1 Tax=Peronospora belbahrii TaxID=622444 RepID=A0AAU9LB10_9STRA|nr:unnamed protein product [Peronospora belbahrii]
MAAETNLQSTAVPDETVKSLHKFKTSLDNTQFKMGVTLGTGSFGRVRFATHKATNTYWAIKILKKAEIIRMQQVEHMLSEKFILLYTAKDNGRKFDVACLVAGLLAFAYT